MSLAGYWSEISGGITNASYADSQHHKFGMPLVRAVTIHYRAGTDPIYYSFNGQDDHGVVSNAVGWIRTATFEPHGANEIWLRGGSGDEVIELYAHP